MVNLHRGYFLRTMTRSLACDCPPGCPGLANVEGALEELLTLMRTV